MLFQKLLQPLAHILHGPGKKMRAKFVHAYNYWFKVPADKLIALKDVGRMLQYSILL
jgi:hypothetical protein